MSTKNEKSSNNQYLIWNEKKNIKKIVTYRCNVIKEIQKNTALNESDEINISSSGNITDKKFKSFIEAAEKSGYTVYRVVRENSLD